MYLIFETISFLILGFLTSYIILLLFPSSSISIKNIFVDKYSHFEISSVLLNGFLVPVVKKLKKSIKVFK